MKRINAKRELKSVFEGRLFHGFTTRSQKKTSSSASAAGLQYFKCVLSSAGVGVEHEKFIYI